MRPTASGTGLVLGERFRASIGFVWPARNGTVSDTALQLRGSDGTGSVYLVRYRSFWLPSASPASALLGLPLVRLFTTGFPSSVVFRANAEDGMHCVWSGPFRPAPARRRHRPDAFRHRTKKECVRLLLVPD